MLKCANITQNTCPKLNGYGENGQRNLKILQVLLVDYQTHIKTGRNMRGFCNVDNVRKIKVTHE
jgi:hypothetical protein